MKWYIDRLEELAKVSPIYSVCGDDCAVCPRFLAANDEDLHETAVFWHRAGWRDHVVTNDEIRCTGCGSRSTCSFMILPCTREQSISACRECRSFPCGKIDDMIIRSAEKQRGCRAACRCEEEYAMFIRAFYDKEKNIGLTGE